MITTNEERELPAAFVRRCLVHQMPFPKDEEKARHFLVGRARVFWKPSVVSNAVCDRVAEDLLADRTEAIRFGRSKPGAAEYLDVLRVLADLRPGDAESQLNSLELAVPWGKSGPPLRPLLPWSRLGPFLKRRLGRQLPGPRLDERRLVRRVGQGLPLGEMPRRPRGIWSERIWVLRDASWHMARFHEDTREVCRRLEREHGKHGLRIQHLRGLPDLALARVVSVDSPVLVLSALGQSVTDDATERGDAGMARSAWQELGRRLEARGIPLVALVPVPRDRWSLELAGLWPSVEWDVWSRLPRRGGASLIPSARTDRLRLTDDLLDALSPASRIEPALLREARLRLGRREVPRPRAHGSR